MIQNQYNWCILLNVKQTLCYLCTVWSTNTSNKTLHKTNSITSTVWVRKKQCTSLLIMLIDIYAIHGCELHQWLTVAAHVTRQSSTASVRWRHGSSSKHCYVFSRFYSHRIQTWAIKATSYLARWILRSHMQYAIKMAAVVIFKFHKVVSKHVNLYDVCVCVYKFPRENDGCKSVYICRSCD